MKIFLSQQNYHIGNFEHNTQKIISAIKEAKSQGADLIVFSEFSICGYPPRDFLYFNNFIDHGMIAKFASDQIPLLKVLSLFICPPTNTSLTWHMLAFADCPKRFTLRQTKANLVGKFLCVICVATRHV